MSVRAGAGAWLPSVELTDWPETGRDFGGIFCCGIAEDVVEATAFCGGAWVWAYYGSEVIAAAPIKLTVLKRVASFIAKLLG